MKFTSKLKALAAVFSMLSYMFPQALARPKSELIDPCKLEQVVELLPTPFNYYYY